MDEDIERWRGGVVAWKTGSDGHKGWIETFLKEL
jgi:hypothetical protein